MATGRVVLSAPDGRLSEAFLPERLSQSNLIQLVRDNAPAGGGSGGVGVSPDPEDPDYVLLSSSSATVDPSDPDYLLIG